MDTEANTHVLFKAMAHKIVRNDFEQLQLARRVKHKEVLYSPRTRIRKLLSLGVPLKLAINIGMSSKGYYHLAKTKAVHMGLSNKWLKEQGLVSLEEPWVKFHYPISG